MSAAVRIIPTEPMVDAAWERYAELARAFREDSALLTDRPHVEAMARAHREFVELFNRWDPVR